MVSVVSASVRTQEAANERMAEAAEFNQFTSGEVMRGSDVIAALMKYRNSIQITVYDGTALKIDSDAVSATDYNLEYISARVIPEEAYKPTVEFNPNGEITLIRFDLQ